MTAALAVASVLMTEVLDGDRREGVVVGAGGHARHVLLADRVLSLVAPTGLLTPNALVTGHLPSVGAIVRVGALRVECPDVTLTVSRWFDPTVRVAGYDAVRAVELLAILDARPEPDPWVGRDDHRQVLASLADGRGIDEVVASLVGRGSGATPSGDDVLAGALAALVAVGDVRSTRLASAVSSRLPTTTPLSAELLRAAARGGMLPQAACVVEALAGGPPLAASLDQLLSVGHASGHHLAAGLAIGAAVASRCGVAP